MNVFTKLIAADSIFFWSFYGGLGIEILQLLLVLIFYAHLPPVVPLFQQLPWGYDRLAIKPAVFLPFFLSLIIFFSNFFFANNIFTKIPLIARMLCATALLICFLSLLITVRLLILIV